jgi:hypothetical protein
VSLVEIFFVSTAALLGLSITFFPVFYIFYKKGDNKLLFVSACIGLSTIVELLVFVGMAPFAFFLIKIAPQYGEMDILNNIIWLLKAADFISEWWLLVLHLFLSVVLPMAIYKRYLVFHLTRPSI